MESRRCLAALRRCLSTFVLSHLPCWLAFSPFTQGDSWSEDEVDDKDRCNQVAPNLWVKFSARVSSEPRKGSLLQWDWDGSLGLPGQCNGIFSMDEGGQAVGGQSIQFLSIPCAIRYPSSRHRLPDHKRVNMLRI